MTGGIYVPVYRIRNLTKIYKTDRMGKVIANDDLSFDIARGEIFGLLGPNGAGKTTLVRQMMGLIKPTSGTIQLSGIPLSGRGIEIIPWHVSYTPQKLGAVADLTAYEGLSVTGRLRGMDPRDAAKQAEELIDEFGLGYLGKRPIGKMSGGEERLVALSMALMAFRPVMILDEPTNDLDPSYRKQVWEKLQALNRMHETTIILVTHNVVEAEKVLERVGIINEGKIRVIGTVGSLKSQIDRRIRINVRLKHDLFGSGEPDKLGFLSQFDGLETRFVSARELLILVPQMKIQGVTDKIIADLDMNSLDDLRIVTPTLEDVYLELGGGVRLDDDE